MDSLKKLSRITGFLYLSLAIIGPFSLMYVPSKIIAAGDLQATVNNILTNGMLFRFGIVGETLMFLVEIAVVALLYRLFKSVNKPLATIAAFSRLAMTVIQGINIMNYLFVLELLNNPTYAKTFETGQLNALVSLFLKGHELGNYTWQVFFGFHLLVLGYLVIKSGYMPKILGFMVMLGSSGYLIQSYGNFLLPGNALMLSAASIGLIVSTVGELSFTLWLLIKGVKEPLSKV